MSFLGIKTIKERRDEALALSSAIQHTLNDGAPYFHNDNVYVRYETDTYVIERTAKLWEPMSVIYIWQPRLRYCGCNLIDNLADRHSYRNIERMSYPDGWYYKRYRRNNSLRCIVIPDYSSRIMIVEELELAIVEYGMNRERDRKERLRIKKQEEEEQKKVVKVFRKLTRFDIMDLG